ncbi:MAG: cobyrinate a,c-diamide synthase [Nitrospirota bacterium]
MGAVIIAGTRSGTGKTTISIGLMAAFKKRGLNVQSFKIGPDFIDPGYHTYITGRPSINLDSWIMSEEIIHENFYDYSACADIAIIEGVMGLFDGRGASNRGSTADIAKMLNIPVILIVDARGMGKSADAVIYGFENYDKGVTIKGIIFHSVSSESHYEYLKYAISPDYRDRLLGYMEINRELSIRERHLGLVTIKEDILSDGLIELLSEKIEDCIDLQKVYDISESYKGRRQNLPSQRERRGGCYASDKYRVRVAVAMDKAFSFYYQYNLDMLEETGVSLIFFSPLKDHLPEDIDGIYIGGGYPEVYARELTNNSILMKEIRLLAEENLPIYAECGGLIYLTKGIFDENHEFYDMVGIFPFSIVMRKGKKRPGYREVELTEDSIIGKKGEIIRGHEFHYTEFTDDIDAQMAKGGEYDNMIKSVYEIAINGDKRNEGYLYRNVLGSYIHLHFGSNTKSVESLTNHFRGYKNRKQSVSV